MRTTDDRREVDATDVAFTLFFQGPAPETPDVVAKIVEPNDEIFVEAEQEAMGFTIQNVAYSGNALITGGPLGAKRQCKVLGVQPWADKYDQDFVEPGVLVRAGWSTAVELPGDQIYVTPPITDCTVNGQSEF